MKEQTKVSWNAIEEMRKQTEAAWYATRPDLYINPISEKDLKDKNNEFDDTSIAMYTLHYTVENVGKSPAIIDSTTSEFIFNNFYRKHVVEYNQMFLPQSKDYVSNMKLILKEGLETIIRIVVYYNWDSSFDDQSKFKYTKILDANFVDSIWSFKLIRAEDFKIMYDTIPEANKIFDNE